MLKKLFWTLRKQYVKENADGYVSNERQEHDTED